MLLLILPPGHVQQYPQVVEFTRLQPLLAVLLTSTSSTDLNKFDSM